MNTTNPRTCSTYLLIFGLVRIFMNSKWRFLFDKLIKERCMPVLPINDGVHDPDKS